MTNARKNLLGNPRILIGLGGLGGTIVFATHQQLQEAGTDHVRTILVDTDDTRVQLDGVSDDLAVSPDVDDQKLQIVRLTGQNLADWREQHSHVLDGVYPATLPPNVSSGAAKLRIVGSAAGLANMTAIRAAIESSMDQVRSVTTADQNVLVVNIVTGCSGGTGSANVLKVAVAVHDIFHKNYDAGQVRLEIRVVVVLPDCYNVVPELLPKVKRNAVFTLRELVAAQRDGLTIHVPNGSESYAMAVPPGFIHTMVPISGKSSAGNISTEKALRALSSFLLLEADPVMGKAIVDELVDIYPDLEDECRQVMGAAAYQLKLADVIPSLTALRRRRSAMLFLALPSVDRSQVKALADTLLPLEFGDLQLGRDLPDFDPAAIVRTWVTDRVGVCSFAGMGRVLSTMADGFKPQDVTTRSAPALRGTDVSGLAESLVNLRYTTATTSVPHPSISLDSDEVRFAGSGAPSRVLDEVDTALATYRRNLQGYFAGHGADVQAVIARFIDTHEGEDLSNLSASLRTAFGHMEQSVAPEVDINSTLARIAGQMQNAVDDEKLVGKAKGWIPVFLGGVAYAEPATSSSAHASDIIGKARNYAQTAFARILAEEWNAFLGRVYTRADEAVTERIGNVVTSHRKLAQRWNGYVGDLQRVVRSVVAVLESTDHLLRDVSTGVIPEPVIPPNLGFRQVVAADVTALEALLPEMDVREQGRGVDIFDDPQGLFGQDLDVATGKVFTANPVVNREIRRILSAGPFLSYNPSRCGGEVVTRIYMSGPAELMQHPTVREKTSRKELRFEIVEGDEVNIVVTTVGIKIGAISGMDAWERELHGQRNDQAVSALYGLKLPSLVEVNEGQVVEPFIIALVCGQQLPTATDQANPWSFCSPDALLRRVGEGDETRWVFQPYPGKGRQAIELGVDLESDVFDAFKLNINNVRDEATTRTRDLVANGGWESLIMHVSEFAGALLREVERLNGQLTTTGRAGGAQQARDLHKLTQQRDTLRELWQRADRWVSEKRRTTSV